MTQQFALGKGVIDRKVIDKNNMVMKTPDFTPLCGKWYRQALGFPSICTVPSVTTVSEYFMRDFPPLPSTPVSPQALLDYLDACALETVKHEHEPLFTVEQSQEHRGRLEGGHTKNLFLKDKKGRLFLLTAQESSDVNLKTLHKLLGASGRFSFGSADKMEANLGLKPGAVSALGVINDRESNVTFAIDQTLLDHEKINCHPLRNDATVTLLVRDLLDLAEQCGHKAMIVDLTADPDGVDA